MSSSRRSKVRKVSLSEDELREVEKHEVKDDALSCTIRRRSRRSIVRNFHSKQKAEGEAKNKRRSSIVRGSLVPTVSEADVSNEDIEPPIENNKEEVSQTLNQPKTAKEDNGVSKEDEAKKTNAPESSTNHEDKIAQDNDCESRAMDVDKPTVCESVSNSGMEVKNATSEYEGSQEVINQARETISRCIEETKVWQELLEKYKALNADQTSQDCDETAVDVLAHLTQDEQDLLNKKADPAKVTGDIIEVMQSFKTKVTSISSALKLCKEFKDVSKAYVTNQVQLLGAKSLSEDAKTPRTLIRAIVKGR